MRLIISMLLLLGGHVSAQNYTSYFTGSTTNILTAPAGGVCLMGGATEDDNAMKWFLQRANGGDVLVLRTTGSNGYNNYLYSTLGVPVNSVETIVCNNAASGNDPYIVQKVKQAEAIWFAGGDQWTYISYWRGTAVGNAINEAIQQRNVVIGGTSAGMAIQGQYYFSAKNGTITSAVAMSNPYNTLVTVDSTNFLSHQSLSNTITDTHFDNPDRRGRLLTFLARIYKDYGVPAKAIVCDEYTAVCIDSSGIAKVFGEYPANDDNAYFIQTNCQLIDQTPENCVPNSPLNWNKNGEAVKVYQVKGTASGTGVINLKDWKTFSGGTWLDWSCSNGAFQSKQGAQPVCNLLPLKLLNFSAKREAYNAVLQWQTTNEVNTSHFDVEKSYDGQSFSKAGTVRSLKTQGINEYTFTDKKLQAAGRVLYRLKQTDIDGKFTYSNIVSLSTEENNENNIELFPIPAATQLTVKAWLADVVSYKITNQQGNIVAVAAFRTTVDVSQLTQGVYYITFYGRNHHTVAVRRFVKM